MLEGLNAYNKNDANAEGDDQDAVDREATRVFEKFDELLHIGLKPLGIKGKSKRMDKVQLVSIPFIRKYIQYCKTHVTPVLTQEAADQISHVYSELRAWEDGREKMYRVMPITARTLETLIRLSTAHAKARLSQKVEEVCFVVWLIC
jgi:DNA replication licensing factor MCM3